MTEQTAVVTKTPQDVIRSQLHKMAPEFKAALPSHVPVDRFVRTVMTAIQTSQGSYQDLMAADRRTLFAAATRAAQMGLLPDGREGAILTRRGKDGVQVCEFRTMVAGVMKMVRNSGEVSVWSVQAVYENDEFDYELGDNERIHHKPTLKERGALIAFYSIVKMKDGEISREVMGIEEVHAIRNRSDAWIAYKNGKIKSTPWSTDEAEMGKKTVVRRHSKRLPLSTDIDGMIREDDEFFEPTQSVPASVAEQPAEPAPQPATRTRPSRLDAVAAQAPVIDDDGVIDVMPTDAAPSSTEPVYEAGEDESPI